MHEQERLDALYKITHTLHHEGSIHTTLRVVLGIAADVLGCRQGSLIAFHEDGSVSDALILHDAGAGPVDRNAWEVLIARGLIAYVRHGQRTIIIRDLSTDPRWPRIHPQIPTTGSAIGLPIIWHGRINGVLTLSHDQVDYFNNDAIDLLETIAKLISSTVSSSVNAAAAQAGEQRYRALFDDAVVAMLITDMAGNIIEANHKAYALLQYPPGSLIHLPISAINRTGTGPIGENRLKVLQNGDELVYRTAARTQAGREIPVMIRARRLLLAEQPIIEWVEQDISDRIELEQLRRELAAVVDGDLRSAVTSITNSFNYLSRTFSSSDPAIADLIQTASRSAHQLSCVMQNLRDIQRMQDGSAALDRKSTSLYNLLATSAQMVQPAARESGHRLLFDLANDLPIIHVDSSVLTRVIVHLLENAVKFTPTGGQITLGAQVQDNCVHIKVSDTGSGIPPEMLKRLFTRYNRTPTSIARFGLAFCKLAVEAHGGSIGVESAASGGAVLHVILPLPARSTKP